MAASYKVYQSAGCDSCRKALKFLDDHEIDYESIPIVDQPPTRAELDRMLEHLGGDLRKLFNTSGLIYREMKLGEKLPKLTPDQALKLLEKNGKLVKRPFVLGRSRGREVGAVGFQEAEWKKNFHK